MTGLGSEAPVVVLTPYAYRGRPRLPEDPNSVTVIDKHEGNIRISRLIWYYRVDGGYRLTLDADGTDIDVAHDVPTMDQLHMILKYLTHGLIEL